MTRFARDYLKARNVGCSYEAAVRFACVRSTSALVRSFGAGR